MYDQTLLYVRAGVARQPDAHLAEIQLDRVELEFSKENGVAISATPPLSELPHAIQLLESIGLIDLSRDEPEVSGDGMSVDVMYRPVNITSGVHVRASLDWTPGDVVKAQYPDWDVQNRSMRIYVSDGQQEPSLAVDFWVKFDRTGRFAIRPGRLVLPESDGPDGRDSVVLEFVDDQLLTMVRKIYTAFHQNFQEFQRDDRILSLERYAPVGRQLMAIEQAWSDGRACTESSSVASAHLPHARITEHLHHRWPDLDRRHYCSRRRR